MRWDDLELEKSGGGWEDVERREERGLARIEEV
jgi:hypothetical protein